MGAIPGSQFGPIYSHYNKEGEWVGAMRDEDAAKLPTSKTGWMKGKAGSITIHHCRTPFMDLCRIIPIECDHF